MKLLAKGFSLGCAMALGLTAVTGCATQAINETVEGWEEETETSVDYSTASDDEMALAAVAGSWTAIQDRAVKLLIDETGVFDITLQDASMESELGEVFESAVFGEIEFAEDINGTYIFTLSREGEEFGTFEVEFEADGFTSGEIGTVSTVQNGEIESVEFTYDGLMG